MSARTPGILAVASVLALPLTAQCVDGVLAQELDAGVAGPRLWTPDGAPLLGTPFSMQVRGGPANAVGLLFTSPTENPLLQPELGATVIPGFPLSARAIELDDEGESPVFVTSESVARTLCGRTLIVQAGILDAEGEWLVSNGLRLRAGIHEGAIPFAELPTGLPSYSTSRGDFDGDGAVDMVGAALGGGVTVLFNNGDGSFDLGPTTTPQAGSSLQIEAGDLNGDGLADAALRCGFSTCLSILIGRGDGTFTEADFPTTVGSHSIGDMTGDGMHDLVVAEISGNRVSIYPGPLVDSLPDPEVLLTTGELGILEPVFLDVLIHDLNEDGLNDLAVAYGTLSPDGWLIFVAAFQARPPGGFGAPDTYLADLLPDPSTSTLSAHLAAGHLDDDGQVDLVVGSGTSVQVLPGQGSGAFGQPTSFPVSAGIIRHLVLGDLSGDGYPDVATNSSSTGSSVLQATGDGGFSGPEFFVPFATGSGGALEIADFDCDGILDINAGPMFINQIGEPLAGRRTAPSSR